MRKELTKTFYDDLKLKKNNFWSPEFGQKYFSVVKSYVHYQSLITENTWINEGLD